MASTSAQKPIRIPISNALLGDDYTGKLYIGSQQKEVNVLLDTGSSTLAVERRSYDPQRDTDAKFTDMIQEVGYADGSKWIGSVVNTNVKVQAGARSIDLPDVALAVAYHESANMFGKSQGILGLAYKPLDDAVSLTKPTVPPKYSPNDVRAGRQTFVEPYFMHLEKKRLVANKYAFLTRRSVIHASKNPAADPLNQGVLILGGGEEATDLYRGQFQTAVVLSDDWYSVNLKGVVVGDGAMIRVDPPMHNSDAPTNAIVDSGTNGLDLDPALFDAIAKQLPARLQRLLHARQVSARDIKLAEWPTLTFVMQGERRDARVVVTPENYWQLNAGERGRAVRSLWRGDSQQSILGLPIMNGYLTVFDNSANHGLGVVKFAPIK